MRRLTKIILILGLVGAVATVVIVALAVHFTRKSDVATPSNATTTAPQSASMASSTTSGRDKPAAPVIGPSTRPMNTTMAMASSTTVLSGTTSVMGITTSMMTTPTVRAANTTTISGGITGSSITMAPTTRAVNTSSVMSMYSVELTFESQTFCPLVSCDDTVHFLQAVQLNVSMNGNYTIKSNSSEDPFALLYKNHVDLNDLSANLLEVDNDDAGNGQFLFNVFLQQATPCILMVSTSEPSVVGIVDITVTGPAHIGFTSVDVSAGETSNVSSVESHYSSALTTSSSMYYPPGVDDDEAHYYRAMRIIPSVAAEFTIECNSSVDTLGFLYNNTFDAVDPSEHLIVSNDDGAGNGQFLLDVFLDVSSTYILVVTTYSPNVTRSFSITARGSGSVTFSDMSG